MPPIRVFIGTEPNQRLSTEVLKHSARARTAAAVQFIELTREGLPAMKMDTGFSFCRWSIPQCCGYEGRAIYLDTDIVVLGDLLDLWNMPMSTGAMAKPQERRYWASVMLLDCARLAHWDFTTLAARAAAEPSFYKGVMWVEPGSIYAPDFSALPGCWNDLDTFNDQTRALHYTDLRRQPWRFPGHPRGWVFRDALRAAIADGAVSAELVRDEIVKGHVRADVLDVA